MKSLLIVLTVLSSLFTTSTYASNDVSTPALRSFQKAFGTATDVVWTTTSSDLYKVNFVLNSQHASAYYNQEGDLMAITRNISSLQLPVVLQASLKKEYQDQWITELFEVSNETGVHYYVTLEDADNKIVLKSNTSAGWSVYLKTRK